MRRFGSIEAPEEVVRQVFLDFVRWPEWMPGVQEVTILEAAEDQAVLDVIHHQFGQTFHIKQRCRIEPDGLRQNQISGKFKSWEARWRFVTPPEGVGTTVSCEMQLDPGLVAFFLPKRVLRGFLDRLYEDCLSGAEAQALAISATTEAPGAGRETLLQVFETDTGLEIWIEGQRFFVEG
jgi:ribosome-associated toxin RatA of RatAB toxin-antitoxin module